MLQERCDRDRMVARFITGLWFSPGTPVSSTNKTDRHDIAEILLKVVLDTKILTLCCGHYSLLAACFILYL